MRVMRWLRLGLLAGALVSVTGCSYIGSLFPDKQKQYRYSTELPDLEIPPDLVGSKTDEAIAESEEGNNSSVSYVQGKTKLSESGTPGKPPKKKRKRLKDSSAVALAENSENVSLIELNEPFAEAWNDVGRALGRLKIEIFDQNRTDGVYYVYYGGVPPKKDDDQGFMDSIASVFSPDKDQAKEYRIKLEDKEEFTFIKVLDQQDNERSTGDAFELLSRLHKKLLNLDQPEPEGEAAKKADEAERQQNEKSDKPEQ